LSKPGLYRGDGIYGGIFFRWGPKLCVFHTAFNFLWPQGLLEKGTLLQGKGFLTLRGSNWSGPATFFEFESQKFLTFPFAPWVLPRRFWGPLFKQFSRLKIHLPCGYSLGYPSKFSYGVFGGKKTTHMGVFRPEIRGTQDEICPLGRYFTRGGATTNI